MKDGTLQRNNTSFPSGNGSPNYMEIATFSALMKHIDTEKNAKCNISCVKNVIFVYMKRFGRNKRFIICKPQGYQAIYLNPTTQGKINPHRFPYLRIKGSPPPLAKIPPPK